jgi:lipopolysaccharide export system permease protein
MTRGIFFRHVLREIAASTLVVALVLLLVLATYQLSFVLGRAADGQVPGAMVPELALLSLRTSLAVILPFALLLGIVLALGRLYHDNEIAAALACGVPASVLFAAAGVAIVVTTVLAGWTALGDGPRAARRVVELRTIALRNIASRQLVPGAFSSPAPDLTIYFSSNAADGSLQDVFVQRDLPGPAARMQVVLARAPACAVRRGSTASPIANCWPRANRDSSPNCIGASAGSSRYWCWAWPQWHWHDFRPGRGVMRACPGRYCCSVSTRVC